MYSYYVLELIFLICMGTSTLCIPLHNQDPYTDIDRRTELDSEDSKADDTKTARCLIKSCHTVYISDQSPLQPRCLWRTCNDVLLSRDIQLLKEHHNLLAETQTDLSVRTKRWHYPDAMLHCMESKCLGMEGPNLYQCVYRKCITTE